MTPALPNPFARRNPVARRRSDGAFDLVLADSVRDDLRHLLDELEDLLSSEPDNADLHRLHPPAYLDHPDQEAAYQILAGDELRTSRQHDIDAMRSSLAATTLDEDQMWRWIRSINAIRLVVGTRLGIDDDDDNEPPSHRELTETEIGLWGLWEFTSVVQHFLIEALGQR